MINLIKKLKKNYLIIFFLLSLSLLWILYTYNDRLQYQTIKKIEYNNVNVKKEYSETVSSKIKDVDINFSMKIEQKNNISNIFNFGTEANPLMMRLVKPSSLQIVIGHNNPLGNKVFSLTDLFEYDKLHKLKIKIFKEKQLWVLFDDALVINIYDKNINFDISNIKIVKAADGTIPDLNIKYTLYRKMPLIPIIKMVLILFFVALSLQLLKKNFKFLTRDERMKYIAFMLFVGFLMAIFYLTGQTILGYTDPKNTFLFTPGNMFGDFIGPVNTPEAVTYSFFTTIVTRFFYIIGAEISLTFFIVGSVTLLTVINIKEIGSNKFNKFSIISSIIFSLLSYHILFVINRGNLEILVFFLLYLFAYYLNRKNFITSAIFLSLAISMKLFPVVFLTETSRTLFIVGSIILLTIINIKEIGDEKFSKSSIIHVIIFSLLSYPVLFVINRGNLEILVFFLLYLFAYYLNRKNFITSAIFLSLAISIKLFPVVFLIVFLSYKKFKAVIYACLLTLFLNITSLVIIVGKSFNSINKIISEYLSFYTGSYIKEYVIDNRGLGYGHSLYGLFKLGIFYFHKSTSITNITLKKVTTLFNLYTRMEIAIFALLSSYIIFIEKELWKKITLLVISMNLLPYVSGDYKLINFFIPLYLFINKKEKSKTDLFYIILFSLLLIPKNYYTRLLNLPDTSLAVFLNPILMIVLALLIIFEGLRNTYAKNYAKKFYKYISK